MAFSAVDRWTAIPWAGPKKGGLTIKIVDGDTGKPLNRATVTLVEEDGVEREPIEVRFATLNYHRGNTKFEGHLSLLRDNFRKS